MTQPQPPTSIDVKFSMIIFLGKLGLYPVVEYEGKLYPMNPAVAAFKQYYASAYRPMPAKRSV